MLKEVKDFARFEYLLCQRLGFKKIPPDKARERLRQAGKRPSRPIEGRETGFEFSAENGLMVVVWTTYLEEKREFREKDTDAGWVLIIQNGKVVHFSRPAPRTKNFLFNLYRRVWINWCRVSNRPSCPECGRLMKIERKRGVLKARFWSCEQRKLHKSGKRNSLDFNFALPPRVKKWLRGVYKRRRKYNIKVRKAGGQLYAAMLKRKRWLPAESKIPRN